MFGLDGEQLEITRGHIFCEAFTSAKEVSGEIGCSEAYTTLLQTNIAMENPPILDDIYQDFDGDFHGLCGYVSFRPGQKNAGNLSEFQGFLPKPTTMRIRGSKVSGGLTKYLHLRSMTI